MTPCISKLLAFSRVSFPPLERILYLYIFISLSPFLSLSAFSVLPFKSFKPLPDSFNPLLDSFRPLLDCLQIAVNTLMDDGELEFSNHEMFSSSNVPDLPSNSLDSFSFIDELLKDTHACTHTHTCNPPGPDNSHTHTCYHVHTKIVPALSDDKTPTDDTAESGEKKSKKRTSGNKEAVRKYREKKKARAASLEEEVVRLRALNQHLFKKLQGQAVLEAEIARLKCLLVDIRGRIEGEIGSFPYQNSTKSGDVYQNLVNTNLPPGSYVMNPCNVQCGDQVYCLHPGSEGKNTEGTTVNEQDFDGCEFENLQCLQTQNSLPGCGPGNGVLNANTSNGNKRKGGRAAAAN